MPTLPIRHRRPVIAAVVLVAVGLVLGALPVLEGVRFDGRSLAAAFLVCLGAFIYLSSRKDTP